MIAEEWRHNFQPNSQQFCNIIFEVLVDIDEGREEVPLLGCTWSRPVNHSYTRSGATGKDLSRGMLEGQLRCALKLTNKRVRRVSPVSLRLAGPRQASTLGGLPPPRPLSQSGGLLPPRPPPSGWRGWGAGASE